VSPPATSVSTTDTHLNDGDASPTLRRIHPASPGPTSLTQHPLPTPTQRTSLLLTTTRSSPLSTRSRSPTTSTLTQHALLTFPPATTCPFPNVTCLGCAEPRRNPSRPLIRLRLPNPPPSTRFSQIFKTFFRLILTTPNPTMISATTTSNYYNIYAPHSLMALDASPTESSHLPGTTSSPGAPPRILFAAFSRTMPLYITCYTPFTCSPLCRSITRSSPLTNAISYFTRPCFFRSTTTTSSPTPSTALFACPFPAWKLSRPFSPTASSTLKRRVLCRRLPDTRPRSVDPLFPTDRLFPLACSLISLVAELQSFLIVSSVASLHIYHYYPSSTSSTTSETVCSRIVQTNMTKFARFGYMCSDKEVYNKQVCELSQKELNDYCKHTRTRTSTRCPINTLQYCNTTPHASLPLCLMYSPSQDNTSQQVQPYKTYVHAPMPISPFTSMTMPDPSTPRSRYFP
jgi:hypothetical protein